VAIGFAEAPPVLRQRLVLRVVASCMVDGIVRALRHHTSGQEWHRVGAPDNSTRSLEEKALFIDGGFLLSRTVISGTDPKRGAQPPGISLAAKICRGG